MTSRLASVDVIRLHLPISRLLRSATGTSDDWASGVTKLFDLPAPMPDRWGVVERRTGLTLSRSSGASKEVLWMPSIGWHFPATDPGGSRRRPTAARAPPARLAHRGLQWLAALQYPCHSFGKTIKTSSHLPSRPRTLRESMRKPESQLLDIHAMAAPIDPFLTVQLSGRSHRRHPP